MGAVALMLGGPTTALAASPSTQPAPQNAPSVNAAAAPSPDPAPQASSFSSTPHTTVTSQPSAGSPVVVSPAVTSAPRSTEPSQPAASSPARTPSTLPAARPTSNDTHASAIRAVATAIPARHRPAADHADKPKPAPAHQTTAAAKPFVLSLVNLRDLPRLPLEAVAATKAARPDGMLLLLSALALGTLVVASLALLRRLTRLHDDWQGRSA